VLNAISFLEAGKLGTVPEADWRTKGVSASECFPGSLRQLLGS
jgi:hypothetical protein